MRLRRRAYAVPNFITTVWHGFLSLFDGIPEGLIAVSVYVGGTLIALWAWYNVIRRLPTGLATVLWILMFALLATPTVSEGNNAGLAPALIGLVFGIVTKDKSLMLYNTMSMLLVMGLGLLIAYCVHQYLRNRIRVD